MEAIEESKIQIDIKPDEKSAVEDESEVQVTAKAVPKETNS